MSSQTLHTSLLRPAIIHILRAAGFHSTRPSVVDTLADLAARYLLLLAERTAFYTYDRTLGSEETHILHSSTHPNPGLSMEIPTISDIRLAFSSAAVFSSSFTPVEEAWQETLRKPLSAFPIGAREKERRRREAEDTRDVREFIDWVMGATNREITRVAGLLSEEFDSSAMIVPAAAGAPGTGVRQPKEDYITVLKKKHSKTGDEARYAGTVLGKSVDDKPPVKIEGGPETLNAWRTSLKRRRDEANMDDGFSRKKSTLVV